MDRRLRASLATTLAATLTVTSAGSLLAQSSETVEPDPDNQPTITGRVETAIAGWAMELGGDPVAVTGFVADHVRSEPYDGVFKGAGGAYLTGAANAADQALLAASLLSGSPAAPPIRFAYCALDEATGNALATEWAAEPVPVPAVDSLEEVVTEIPEGELRQALEEVVAFHSDVSAQADEDAAALAADLEAAGWQAVPPVPPTLTEHVWLQADIDGVCADFHSSTPDGAPPRAAMETFEALPPAMAHRLTIRVIAEHLTGGVLEETTRLELARATSELATARMAFAFGEPAGLIGAARASDADWAYTPVLRVDNETIAGEPLSLPAIQSTTGAAFESAAEGLGGLLGGDGAEDAGGGLLGGLGSDEQAVEAPAVDSPTGAWLELELERPHDDALIVRSEIFDRVGAAARQAQPAALTPAELATIGGDYAAMQSLWQIGLIPGPNLAPEGVPSLDGVLLTSFDGHSGSLDALLRSFPGWQGRWRGTPGLPTVLLLGLETDVDGSGEADERVILDALHVPGRYPTDASGAARDAYSALVAEAMLHSAAADEADPLGSATGVFRAARAAGTPMLHVADVADLDTVQASEAALARLGERVAAGYTAVVPATPPTVGKASATSWFLIDPVTGIVRDQHENGRHTEYGERAGVEGGTKPGLLRSTWNSACRLGKSYGMAVMMAVVLVSPAGGDNAVRSAVQQTVEQQKRLDRARAAACGEAGQG